MTLSAFRDKVKETDDFLLLGLSPGKWGNGNEGNVI